MVDNKMRVARLEARMPLPHEERVTEVHRVIVNSDGTPALLPDGTPWVITSRVISNREEIA